MNRAIIAALCAALAGCATTTSVVLTATKSFTVAETTFDAVIVTADNAINTGALPPAAVGKIHTLGDAGYAYVRAGRTAILAGNATSVQQETDALKVLVPQIVALIPTK